MRAPAVCALLLAAIARAQRPSPEEQEALISKARSAALHYSASLPDFICTQIVHRSEDPRGDNRWLTIDVLTVRLTFFGRGEDYKLIEINGKPTTREFMQVGGSTSKGEFGTLLMLLFHPDSQTDFKWKGWGTYKKHRVATYTYRVDQTHSMYTVSYGVMPANNSIHPAYHGEIQFDPESGMILHVFQQAEMLLNFPIRQSTVSIDYDYTDVGGNRYLLPLRADVLLSAGPYKGRNVVDFKNYRKFQAETTIKFDKP
jgi:hypothetical protein